MAKRKKIPRKINRKMNKEETRAMIIELLKFRIQKRRQQAKNLAAKYFDPNKLATAKKHSELVEDIIALIDAIEWGVEVKEDVHA